MAMGWRVAFSGWAECGSHKQMIPQPSISISPNNQDAATGGLRNGLGTGANLRSEQSHWNEIASTSYFRIAYGERRDQERATRVGLLAGEKRNPSRHTAGEAPLVAPCSPRLAVPVPNKRRRLLRQSRATWLRSGLAGTSECAVAGYIRFPHFFVHSEVLLYDMH